MRNRVLLTAAFVALALTLSSCKASITTGGNSSNTANQAANSNASAANTNTANAGKPDQKAQIQNEKRPEGQEVKGLPSDKKVPVPANWIYYADEVKGYGFWLPDGSTSESSTEGNMDIFRAEVPRPSEVWVDIYAWKDRTLTKQDLLDMTLNGIRDGGETVTAGTLKSENDDYAVAEASSTDKEGKKYKMKILVGTDITDNYVMVVYTFEDKYEANRGTIDAIWANFEMYSGGASGNS